jgi:Fe-S oxidoreductase
MTERIASGFHPFVLPFLFGMAFVLGYCVYGIVKILLQLSHEDRRKFLISLVTPRTMLKNFKDIFLDCLIHVKLWKRNKLLGYMHSSIAFGWFMLIVLGHIEVMFYLPDRLKTFYYPIFFNFFVAKGDSTIGGSVFFFLMDFFLALVLSGIILAIIKRVRSRLFGMRRTTRLSALDTVGLYALWSIFPLRLLAEGFTASISGGSFLTVPLDRLFNYFLGNDMNMLPTWWAYSIALCVFMVVLPFTRYMHIPAEMMLIPMRNAGLKIEHARRGFARVMVYSCPNCGVCIDACPMSVKKANTKDTTVYLNRQIRRGNEKRIEEISDKCLLCGKCSAVCQIGIEAPKIRIAQRAHRKYSFNQDFSNIPSVVPQGIGFDSSAAGISDASMAPGASAGCGKVLYFAGCMTALTPRIGRAVESVLKKAGVEYSFLDRDGGLCCGRPLLTAGRFEEAKQLMAKNTEIILASGCDTLLLSCPICYKIFNERYHLEGIRVVHHSVFLNELVRDGRLHLDASGACGDAGAVPGAAVGDSFVYHDPCELGRGSGIYDQPRELLRSAGPLVEAGKTREESICCGGSIGSLSLGFDQREALTRNALKNLTVAGPSVIATACPLCLATFSRYSDRPVRDIAEIIDEKAGF